MIRSRARAFTLVELLVVIAIIGVLVGLLLPAIGMVRETARRTECSNNIKQLCYGFAQHESNKGRLPGLQEIVHQDSSGVRVGSWAVTILPYIDQRDLYERWSQPTGSADTPFLPLMHCASKGTPDKSLPVNSYVANAGFARNTGGGSTYTVPPPSSIPSDHYWIAGRKANGPLIDRVVPPSWRGIAGAREHELKVSTSDFKDGASNTLLISENLLAGDWHTVSPWQLSSGTGGPFFPPTGFVWLYATDGNPPDTTGGNLPPDARINSPMPREATLDSVVRCRPSSNHPGGVNVGFADGGVRFLSDRITYNVYQHLMTPDGKKSDLPFKNYLLTAADYDL